MADKKALIDSYLDAFLDANERINLTNITDKQQASLLHVEDSLAGFDEVQSAPAGRYGDLGSGGGFPGVPIGVMTERPTVLIDSVKKKMRTVQGILETLGIQEQIRTYDGRIEELALQEPESFAVLTARALSSLPSLLELASPLLMQNGILVCYKAHVSEDELNVARQVAQKVGMTLESSRDFTLSDGETQRAIIVFRKTGKPQMKLPRRIGMAQKNPLSS